MMARRVAATAHDFRDELHRLGIGIVGPVRMLGTQDDYPRTLLVGDFGAAFWQEMHTAEDTPVPFLIPQAFPRLIQDFVFIHALRAILSRAVDRGAGVIPVARAIVIEIGQLVAHAAQGIAEYASSFPRLHRRQVDPHFLDAANTLC